jgi:hypothetical protein
LVDQVQKRKDCCPAGNCAECNQDGRLTDALTITGNLRQNVVFGQPDFGQVVQGVHARAPLGVHVRWQKGSGHFVGVHGYTLLDNKLKVHVADPWHGPQEWEYGKPYLLDDGAGTWNASYWTR